MSVIEKSGKTKLVLVYNKHWVQNILAQSSVKTYLASKGYQTSSEVPKIVEDLIDRIKPDTLFPHEIGVILGYPVEDVIAFEKNQGQQCKYCGYWKSYSDVDKAKQCQCSYKRCSGMCKKMFDAAKAAGAEVIYGTADSADKAAVLSCDILLLRSPAMGDEVLEDTMEEFFASIESSIGSKKVAVFGSYDWGDGQWLRDWAERIKKSRCSSGSRTPYGNYPLRFRPGKVQGMGNRCY